MKAGLKVLLVLIVAVLYEGWEVSSMPERHFSWKDHVPTTLSSILFIAQIVVGIYLLSEVSQIERALHFF